MCISLVSDVIGLEYTYIYIFTYTDTRYIYIERKRYMCIYWYMYRMFDIEFVKISEADIPSILT